MRTSTSMPYYSSSVLSKRCACSGFYHVKLSRECGDPTGVQRGWNSCVWNLVGLRKSFRLTAYYMLHQERTADACSMPTLSDSSSAHPAVLLECELTISVDQWILAFFVFLSIFFVYRDVYEAPSRIRLPSILSIAAPLILRPLHH